MTPSGGGFDHSDNRHRLEEIDRQLASSLSWDKPEALTPILREKSRLGNDIARTGKLESLKNDVSDWLALVGEEETEDTLASLHDALAALTAALIKAEMEMLLADRDDGQNAIMEIHPGAGGTEAQDWVSMLLRMYQRWCDVHGFSAEILDYLDGDEAGLKSVTLGIKGENAYGLLKNEKGVHRLIRISPFDASGRRHTSFASVDVIPDVGEDITIDIREEDLRIDVFRASGAGGQHVNRTNSAVRITHLPTNIVVQCQNEKSQHRNKDTAMQILRGRLYERERRLLEETHKNQYQAKDAINFGSQIRTYTLQPYRLVKDHRSGTETGDVDAVLNGALDTIIKDLLLHCHAAKTAT
ncbi:peptide chain release factor 2 [Deltaproteobacteria bacterium]|nr:peptide chain release factor 2 [Deltaproteobacteria bacterium]